ncbi:MAG: outer membrane protein assembly factor BamD [Fibrobacter sp.]|uniref:outer membrane protein assembly factor BamD n=1 Tax=Fibrobacter sp. TaxID=35828 RepID=UPI0025BDDF68|nr:outer membrane protein assembly factor BamD [Fibrobacter sp.]MBR4783894.1 outer membrane protein assembly factor BamD [Fibrobacter sp.]
MKLSLKTALFTSLFLSVAMLGACSSSSSTRVTHTQFCKDKLEKAEELFKKEKYGRVIDKLEEIMSYCAGTGYLEQTSFLLAESHFNLEQWIEARGEYGSFVMNFPGSPYAETAEFRKAIASFNMEFRVSRDDANTTVAMKDFERYLSNHPDSPLRDSINYYYGLLIERLAEKEFQTARLYLRMDKPQAAVIYFKEFLETYKQSKRRKEALFLTSQAYTELDQFESAREYLNIARQELKADDKDGQKMLEKTEEKIAKAEKSFEKRIKKDAEKKRVQKEEREMLN